ncbi:MAG: hypothetical protein H6632_02155 [Anaerolineales bacterium]|nr:hypothetical protein [Anaerolineales bacterium]
MKSKHFWRDLALIFGLALVVRTLTALPQQQPSYFDAAYYYVNGVNLAEGRGFVEDFVWNYLNHPGPPPQPSHLYWMPLTSILAAVGLIAGGVSYRAAQIPFVVLSALVAPITYWLAYLLTGQRWSSWLAGLFALFSGFYGPYWTAIDNFTPFAVFGSMALALAGLENEKWRMANEEWKPETGDKRVSGSGLRLLGLMGAGVCIGLAHLSRADGSLLLIAIILLFGLRMMYYTFLRPIPHISRSIFHDLRALFLISLAYLLTMLPWFLRTYEVTGSFLSTAGTQTIWLTNYDDLFSYGRELSLQTFLAQGIGPIGQGRWWALTNNLQTVLAVWGMIFLGPLALIGGWHLRHRIVVQLAAMYALLLFIAMTFVFAFPGARGGLFHSGAALVPFIYATAVIGLNRSIEWVAERRPRWRPKTAKRIFGVGLVVMAASLSSFIYYQRVLKGNAWNGADSIYPAIAAWVAEQNPAATVMIGNPPAYRYHGGGLSVVVPNNDIETVLQVMAEYRVDYLVLDKDHPVPLAEIYDHPEAQSDLSLLQTFRPGSGQEIYIFGER